VGQATGGGRTVGLTDKNWELVRKVLTPGVWRSVAALPDDLMQAARTTRDRSPVKAAVIAQMAVAIGILLVAQDFLRQVQ
jgi:hypothetical protein